MNGSEEPIEIKVEPEIHDLLPFEDFDIDQFVDYLQNDDELASTNHQINETTPSPIHQTGYTNNFTHDPTTQSVSPVEKFFYTCTVCREILDNSQELLKHVRTHTRLKAFKSEKSNSLNGPKCCICRKRFSDLKTLTQHERTHHPPPFKCRFCSSMFGMLKLYKIHLNFHTKQQRRNVPDQKTQHNKKEWGKNVYASHLNAYRPSSVQTSNQGLLMQFNQPRHQLNHSSPKQQRTMRCKYCDKQFAKLSSLKKHQMLHESIEGRVGDVDLMRNRSMSRSSNEFVHMNQSSSSAISKPGSLTLTPSLLSNLNKLANLNSADGRDGKKPAILININTNDSMKEENPTKLQELPVGGGASGLMISSVTGVDKKQYEKAERNANKSTVMIQNGKKAISLSDLQCPICKKIVSQPFSLKIHLRTHTMERPFSCTVCGKKFSQSCNLKTHMKTHSMNPQQPMQCNICKKVFSRASTLNSHMISHTAKLYCYACSINFDEDVLSYSQHMQTKHFVTMTKDCMSRTRINLQQQQTENFNQRLGESLASIVKVEAPDEKPQQRLMEVFQVQSSSVTNGQIPKLKITIKKEPVQTTVANEAPEKADGNDSDSSSSSNSSSSGSSSSSSSGSSSSSSSSSNDEQDNK